MPQSTSLDDLIGIEHSKLGFFQELRQTIVQLKAAHRESERSRLEIEAILDGITDLMMVLSKDLRIIAVNHVFYEILGVQAPEGRYCYEIFRQQDHPCPECPAHRSFVTDEVCRETSIFRINGRKLQFEMVASPIKDPATQDRQILIFKRDVTLEKEFQAKFHQAEKMATVGMLAAGVAHEVNNPLTAIHGFAEGILRRVERLRGAVDPEMHADLADYAGTILGECRRCQEIVHSLLTFSRPHSSEFSPVNLNGVVGDTLKLLHNHLKQPKYHHVRIDARPCPTAPVVLGCEAQLKQVMLNLLVNALDAFDALGGQGGAVRAVLHHQAGGPGHRHRTVHLLHHRHGTRRRHPRGKPGRRGLHVHRHAAASAGVTDVRTAYTVLAVDDEPSIGKLLEKELSTPIRAVHVATSARQARERLRRATYEVVVLDIRLPDADGIEFMVELRQRYPDTEVILITGHGNIDNAVEAMKLGAYDYITKPFNLTELEVVVERAYQRAFLRNENRALRHARDGARPAVTLIGNSQSIKEVRYLIEKVAPTDVPVLITGESGAGKEVAAHAIQSLGSRADKPFIIKNCATLQKELARSELFGHVRGSFTGALESRDGLMAFANKGTLFLDEIGELPVEVQASLLRVLENKTYRRVGEKDHRSCDIRLIFATNRALAGEVEVGRFHEALYHRINVFNIEMPPLRERKEDIPLLAEFFLARLGNGRDDLRISDRAMACLMQYAWPGNVRELRNVLERSIILAENNLITEHALPRELAGLAGGTGGSGGGQAGGMAGGGAPGQHGATGESQGPLTLEAMEREHIARILEFYDNNRSLAATALGISRKTLYRKMREYDIG